MSQPADSPSGDLARYQRQAILDGVGEAGQRRLLGAHAAVVGVGALGCAVADLLARAGVGRLTLIDRDVVEPTNLQRQTLFTEADAAAGLPKAEAARRRLGAVNAGVDVEPVVADVTPSDAERLVLDGRHGRPDVVLDGADSFATRLLVNDVCVRHGVPLAYAGVVGFGGMAALLDPGRGGPCFRCVAPEPPPAELTPTCDTVGVFGPAVFAATGWQAGLALRVLLGDRSGAGVLFGLDLAAGRVRRMELAHDPACRCCVGRDFAYLDGRLGGGSAELCGQDAVQVGGGSRVELSALARRLAPHGRFTANAFLVQGELVDAALGLTVFADGRAIVRGTTDPAVARTIYARYVGG